MDRQIDSRAQPGSQVGRRHFHRAHESHMEGIATSSSEMIMSSMNSAARDQRAFNGPPSHTLSARGQRRPPPQDQLKVGDINGAHVDPPRPRSRGGTAAQYSRNGYAGTAMVSVGVADGETDNGRSRRHYAAHSDTSASQSRIRGAAGDAPPRRGSVATAEIFQHSLRGRVVSYNGYHQGVFRESGDSAVGEVSRAAHQQARFFSDRGVGKKQFAAGPSDAGPVAKGTVARANSELVRQCANQGPPVCGGSGAGGSSWLW
mmetsp:Transcript_32035/g.83031  ORF Transcript_32035/g.83031 Transcript_32035/m.83031 type:complete len:260 (-) Transcript_32035:62-841(-)